MALSGSFYTNVGSYWRLQLEWTATQSISGNYSDVTARLYWIDRGSHTGVISSASKTASITIGSSSGTTTTTAGLNRNQKKLIHTRTVRVNHNDSGTGSVTLDGYFDAKVTLSGTYYNRINLTAKTVTLDTIPRASSITSSASWTAGSNRSVTISRASSRFTHTVRWQVQDTGGTWRTIKTATGVGTSVSSSFTTAQNKDIFNRLAQNSSRPSRIEIETFNGSTKIGDTVRKTGTVTAPSSSTLTSGADRSMYIDDSVYIGISRNNSNFHHTAVLKVGSYSKSITDIGTSTTWNPTTAEENSLYAQLSTQNSRSGTLELTTYYDGVQVRSTRSYTFTFRVRNADPTFSGGFTFRDTNATTTLITGNNQYIIQNKSTLRVEIPSTASATANRGASMAKYSVTVNGVTKDINYSTATVFTDFGTINSDSNVTVTVRAIDSRGNSTSSSRTITVLPYRNPTINIKANRLNSFEEETTLSVSGEISPLKVGTTDKNSISVFRYRYKKRADSIYSGWVNLTANMSGEKYTSNSVVLTLDNLLAWDIQVEVVDKLSTEIENKTVPVGKPIMFIDAGKNSIGFNRLPSRNYTVEVDGYVHFYNPNSPNWVARIGSGSTAGRNFIGIRSDGHNPSLKSGATINLYGADDPTYPNQMSLYFGGRNGNASVVGTEGAFKIRIPNASGQNTNYLSFMNAQEVGISSDRYELAIIQETGTNRVLYFDTSSSGTNMSIEVTGRLIAGGRVIADQGVTLGNRYVATNGHLFYNQNTHEFRAYSSGSWYSLYRNGSGGYNLATDTTVLEAGGMLTTANSIYMGVSSSGELRVTSTRGYNNGDGITYRPLRSSNVIPTSSEKWKTNIRTFDGLALPLINDTTIYNYNLKDEYENQDDPNSRYGVIIERETPKEIIDGDGVDLYGMASLAWKAIQELSAEVEYLRDKLERK